MQRAKHISLNISIALNSFEFIGHKTIKYIIKPIENEININNQIIVYPYKNTITIEYTNLLKMNKGHINK